MKVSTVLVYSQKKKKAGAFACLSIEVAAEILHCDAF